MAESLKKSVNSKTEAKGAQGVWTALITPFDSEDGLDLAAFRKVLEAQKKAGVSGVIPCGTTGESPTLGLHEKQKLIETALEVLDGSPVRVFAGTGTNDTAETLEFSKWASDHGVDGVLVVTPYYNKPSQAGLEHHFRAVADHVDCEVMLYNVPGRTGVSLSVETVCALASHPNIRSIKEATGNVAFSSEILDELGFNKKELCLLAGDDATFLPLMAIGASGVVSVASNLIPRAMVELYEAARSGDSASAKKIHQFYFPVFKNLFIDSNPVPLKHAMSYVGYCETRARPPLAPLSTSDASRLDQTLKRCEIPKKGGER